MKTRIIVALLLLILVLVFALQNAATVEIRFLLWTFAFHRSALIVTLLLVGILIGWFARPMLRISRGIRQR